MRAKAKTKQNRRASPAPPAPGVQVLLTSEEIRRDVLKIGETLFEQMVREGRFPRADVRLGRCHRWRASTVNAWVAGQEV